MKRILFFRKILATLVCGLLCSGFAIGQVMTDQQKETFRKEVEKLLKVYADAASLTTQDKFDLNKANTLNASFIETQKPVVFNDMLPLKVEGDKYLSPASYTHFAQQFYPDGLDIRFTVNDIFFEPRAVKGYYTAIVKVSKKTRGFYASKRIHTFTGTLYFFVQASFADALIQKIGISMVADAEKYAQFMSNRSYGGLYAGLSGTYNQSMVLNQAIISNTRWDTKLGSGISPSIDVYYMVTKGFGVGVGLRFGSYSYKLILEDFNEQLGSTVTDVDGDSYYPKFEIPNLEELDAYKTMDIPICIKFRGGKGKAGMYFDVGVVYSTFRSANYTLNGTATTKGYYQAYSVLLEDIPEYNFTTTEYKSYTKTITTPNKNISAFASFGVAFMVYPDIFMRIGIGSQFGLTDLLYNKSRHPVDFYATTGLSGAKTSLLSFGGEIGVSYRILSGAK